MKGRIISFFFSSRRRHTRWTGDWSSDVCSSDLELARKRVSAGFGVALVGEEFPMRQIVEQRLEIVPGPRMHLELLRELGAAMLAPREQPQGPLAQAGLAPHRPPRPRR